MSCGGGGAASAPMPSCMTSTRIDITDKVEKGKVAVLNSVGGDASALFVPGNTSVVRSDADSQMIIFVPFSELIKLYAIKIDGPEGERPTVIKLFANHPSLGFADAEEGETEALRPKSSEFGKELKVKYAKFQHVSHLYIFVDNEGEATSALSSLTFIGQTVAASDVSKIQKVG